jgi:hypothetical protein
MSTANLEQDVVEAPCLRREHRRQTDLALLDQKRKIDRACTGISRGPRLARPSVGGVPISPEGLAIDPCLRNRIDSLLARQATGA